LLEETLAALDAEDLRVLSIIESLRDRFEYVPLELIESRSRLPPARLSTVLGKLRSMRLVDFRVGSFTGYTITFKGLDVLALHYLKSRGVVKRLGDRVGAGKEGDVYLAEGPGGLVVVKFHRGGVRSFKKVKRFRGYVEDLPTDWIEYAKLIGEREYKVMVKLHEAKAMVPKPLGWNRHAVAQEYIEGVELYKVKSPDPQEALAVLNSILETLRIAYTKVRVVHGDLSEYNVLVSNSLEAYIIDWPQYVYVEDPRAGPLLKRDLEYILRFFKRRFGLTRDLEWALKFVRGELIESS